MSYSCYGCLKPIKSEGYCPACVKNLWGGNKKISIVLPFAKKEYSQIEREQVLHLSISGVQDKISLAIIDNTLVPVSKGGAYILKPVPSVTILPQFNTDIPANEQLTMQLASQVFQLRTAVNGLVRFSSGELVYITKRFDRVNNVQIAQEDFCQLSGRTSVTHGNNYKYDSSYQEVGEILKKYCKAYPVEIEKIFQIILFNFLIGNGDAHLKNFSLYQIDDDDHILTPFYDLLSTALHLPQETWFALDLFKSGFSEKFQKIGFPTGSDFIALAQVYGIAPKRVSRYIESFAGKSDQLQDLVSRSYLTAAARAAYLEIFNDRLKALTL